MKKDYNRLTMCRLSAVVLGLMVVMQPASAGPGQESAEQQDPWAAYKVIVERSMFSRQRGVRRERPDRNDRQTLTPARAPNPESFYLLKGIVQEDSEFIAFLEDTQRGGIVRVRQSDKVARGVVKALTLDSIEYQFEDRTTVVAMGQDLEGGRGAMSISDLLEGLQTSAILPTAEQQGTSPGPAPTGDEADILKKLMERRQQQLGQ